MTYIFKGKDNGEERLIKRISDSIKRPSKKEEDLAKEYNDSLCKPLGSLGYLENAYIRLRGIYGSKRIESFNKAVIVYSADNGVWEEGISSNPQDTTYKICENILSGGSGLCKISQFYGVKVELEDLGVLKDVVGHTNWKIVYGSKNPLKEKALKREEAIRGILAGMEKTKEMVDKGYNLMGFGEMGVGNTTTSSAVISALTGEPGENTVGMGSGLTRESYNKKIAVVNEAIKKHSPFYDVVDILSSVGGLDICAMVGSYLMCANLGIAFLLDGVISMAALLAAVEFNPLVKEYAFSSHKTVEKGARIVEKILELTPPLNLSLRLGEGSGCPIGMNLLELSLNTIQNMATFKEVAVDKKDYIDIRKGEKNEKKY